MMSPLQLIRHFQEARQEHIKYLEEHPEDSTSGKRFRQLYKIGDKLGFGAFSVVKEGTHKQSHKTYAVKIVNKNHLSEQDAKGLEQEIEILRSLSHPHIVILYDVFNGTDYKYLITEKINGGNLYDRIAKKGKYIEQDARIASRVLFETFTYIHKHSIVHRDLKLENILLQSYDNDWDVKVIDFGFAKRAPSANGLHTFIGTPGYVAPCILEGVGYGTQADVWSLGVVLYMLLGGYPPFRDRDQQKLFRKIRKGKFEYHESKWKDVSSGAKDLINHLLMVNPFERLTAAGALEHGWFENSAEEDDSVMGSMRSTSQMSIPSKNSEVTEETGGDNPAEEATAKDPSTITYTV